MRVFALTTGRTGSVTFAKACEHVENFTSGHESRFNKAGTDRLDYSDQHIEADCRLSFFLGLMARRYPDAFYIHMRRSLGGIADSFTRCHKQSAYTGSVVAAWGKSIEPMSQGDYHKAALDYATATDANISEFLKDREHMVFEIENDPKAAFVLFWERIGATGDLDAALAEFDTKHNSGPKA